MRAAIYARYSSAQQRDASIQDQLEVCRRYTDAQGWTVVATYTDAAISGASGQRPGFQSLRADAGRRRFDVVVCEAVDRLGRRLADTSDLLDVLAFYGIKLFTPQLGEVTAIHMAVMGMMAQMALKDLGEKTRRGQLGRVLKGRIAGGHAYGYDVLPGTGEGRRTERGLRRINAKEAAIVRRIFREYAAGASPEMIVHRLNKEGVPGPGSRPWNNSTIRGQAGRGNGFLNNELYRGVIAWNRCSYIKDPRTGRRQARPNARERWEIVEAPELRIVDQDLWDRAKARQKSIRQRLPAGNRSGSQPPTADGLNGTRRVRFLLSGLLRCECCGGPYAIIGKDRYGCSTRRQKGTCSNRATITRQEIEGRVLAGLKDRLLDPDLTQAFIEEYYREQKLLSAVAVEDETRAARALASVERKIASILKAIEDGMYHGSMKQRLAALEGERGELKATLEAAIVRDNPVQPHLNLPEVYRRKVAELEKALEGPGSAEAIETIRSLIDRVELVPRKDGSMEARLFGQLAQIMALAEAGALKQQRPGEMPGRQLSVVAGTGFEPVTFRL